MKQLYGTSFLTIYGETPSPIWEHAIAKLTDEECRDGLTALAKQPREFPANLTEFVGACRPKSAGVRYLGRPVDPATLALPVPRASEERRQAVLDKLRRTVGAAVGPRKNGHKRDDDLRDEEPRLLEGRELHEERMRQMNGLLELAKRGLA